MLHHITAICSDVQTNFDFYAKVLGLRLVKQTVNFDAPDTYHTYFGNRDGSPGTLLTFFPFANAAKGVPGIGQASEIQFSVPSGSLDAWKARLDRHKVEHQTIERFGQSVLFLSDPDDLPLLLVETETTHVEPWIDDRLTDPVDKSMAITSFHGVTLCVARAEPTAQVLTALFDYHLTHQADGWQRYRSSGPRAAVVDLQLSPERPFGQLGSGSVHHVAFRAVDDADELHKRQLAAQLGLHPTEVIDRQYFHSVYFREPGRILFEIATDPPGMTIDGETEDTLGSTLQLPPQYEPQREQIEAMLPAFDTNV